MAGGFQISCTHFLLILTLIQDPTILVGLRNVRFVNFVPLQCFIGNSWGPISSVMKKEFDWSDKVDSEFR